MMIKVRINSNAIQSFQKEVCTEGQLVFGIEIAFQTNPILYIKLYIKIVLD